MMRHLKLSVIALLLVCFACGKTGNNAQENHQEQKKSDVQTDPFPWDFPQDINLDAETGQTVLSCYTFYSIALKNGKNLLDQKLTFYNTTLRELGDTSSIMENRAIIPNALIIPLPKQILKPHKGDILLTWWQGGNGLQRAIVVNDSIVSEPIVDYLDMDYSDSTGKQGLAQAVSGEQLSKGTYAIITLDQWQSGAQIAAKTDDGQWMAVMLIHEKDNKVLTLGVDSKVRAFSKADCRFIPISTQWNEGESVWAAFNGIYQPGYNITHADNEKGRVTVEKNGKKHTLSITKIARNFNEQLPKTQASASSESEKNKKNSGKIDIKKEKQKKK